MQQTAVKTTISTGVYNVAENYRAMILPEMENGDRISNALMQSYLEEIDNGASILDAPCGTGCYAGVTANMGKDFYVAVSDASPDMLTHAIARLTRQGHAVDSHQAKLDQLKGKQEWSNKFDLAFVPNVASELFGDMPETAYEDHIIASLTGVKSVLKKDGVALIDARNWKETFELHWKETSRSNAHDGTIYHARYDWNFGRKIDGVHTVRTQFWNEHEGVDKANSNVIRFAGRTEKQLEELFQKAGFNVVDKNNETRGINDEPFTTFALKISKNYG